MTKRQYFRWTEEVKKEVRRLIVLSWTHQQIADHFGISKRSVGNGIVVHKLSSMDRAAFNTSIRQRGRKRPSSFSRKISDSNTKRWADPELRAALEASALRNLSGVDRQKSAATRRGVKFTGESLQIYRELRRKKLSKEECVAMVADYEEKANARPHA